MHPALKVSSSNVAPEFGVIETRSYLLLADFEKRLSSMGLIEKTSDTADILRRAAVETGRWRKWMLPEQADLKVEEVLKDQDLTYLIADISGHYTFEIPEVASALKQMLDQLENVNVPARRFVLDSIKRSIGRYVSAYNLRGLTTKLREFAE